MDFFNNKEDRFELHLDHGKLVLVAIGVLLVGALLFLLGMLVGRSFLATSTDPMARIDAATSERVSTTPLEPEVMQKKPAKRPEYTFYENVKKPEGQGAETLPARSVATEEKSSTTLIMPRAPEKPEPSEVAEAFQPASKPLLIAPVLPAPKVAQLETAPPKAAAKAPAPAAKKSAPLNPATFFTVQVGSFQKRSAAKKMASQLKAKGIETTLREAKVKGVNWYRVQVGEFATRNKARAHYEKKLKPKGIKGFILTR